MKKLAVKILALTMAITSLVGCDESEINDVSTIAEPIAELVEEALIPDELVETPVEEETVPDELVETPVEAENPTEVEAITSLAQETPVDELVETPVEEEIVPEVEETPVEEEIVPDEVEEATVDEEVIPDELVETPIEEVVIPEVEETAVEEVEETPIEEEVIPEVEETLTQEEIIPEVEETPTQEVEETPVEEVVPEVVETPVTTSNVTPTTVPDATLKSEIYNMLISQANSPTQMTVYGTAVPASSYMYRNMLSSTEQQLYDQLYNGFIKAQSSFDYSTTLSSDTVFKIAEYIHYDHPELIWINLMNYTITTSSSGSSTLNAASTYNGLQNSTSTYYSTMATILANAKNLPSNYDKIKYVQNYISYYTTFDVSYVTASDSQTAYSCLIGKRTVCAGYARAFQHCMQLLGIPTTTISGSTIYGTHLWNLLTLEGQNYIVDVNWDDWSTTPTQYNYSYFMITDAQLSASRGSHVRSSFSANLPYAYGTTYSYANKG